MQFGGIKMCFKHDEEIAYQCPLVRCSKCKEVYESTEIKDGICIFCRKDEKVSLDPINQDLWVLFGKDAGFS